ERDPSEHNARLQLRLVEDLLDLNQIMYGKVQLDRAIHDLFAVLRSSLETVQPAAQEKGIEVELVEERELLIVEGDLGRLQQIFSNVLGNAVKFTPSGGRIQVTAARDSDRAVVKIQDTGKGIAPEFLPHVFDMFRQQEG